MKTKMKYLSAFIISCGLVTTASAVAPGAYVGGQVGMSNLHNKTTDVQTGLTSPATVRTSPSNTGVGSRIFLGYSISQYAAVEGGYTYYTSSTYKPSEVAPCQSTPSIRTNAFDLVGKGTYPFAETGFGVFAKAGVAFASVKTSGSLIPDTVNACGSNSGSSSSMKSRPTVGFGASYDLTQNWVADVSWSRIMSGSGIQNADLLALGVSYHFVDKYCGQFLCD